MQRKYAQPLLIVGLLAVAGVSGGLILGDFTTGEGASGAQAMLPSWTIDVPEQTEAPMLASVAVTDGPRSYVCKGCGPTLAEQRAKEAYAADSHEPDDPALLPSYHPDDAPMADYGQKAQVY